MRNVNFESLEFKILSGKHKFNFLNGISDMKGYGPPTHAEWANFQLSDFSYRK